MSSLPTGTLTFLFTDLVDHTPLWEQFPDAMRLALARHDALLKEAVKNHSGRIVKTTGDGLHAVFESASDGVAAALAGQQALAAEPWPAETGPLRVRMGLHIGESQERDGDYYGPEVNRAARIMGIGHGGQILISEVTAVLLRGHLPKEITLSDLGRHRLKGLSAAEQIFQVCHPSLKLAFPPLKTLDTFPNNLPIQLTSFVGRAREIEEARQLLAGARLVTLTGPGGTGKTRLALQVGDEILAAFADGVWLIELAPLADPALIVQTIASVFGLREMRGRSLNDLVTDYLRAKRLLLILDNCEHLIEACARLADHLLHACPHLKILASSREALGIAGETAYRVPSLSLPDAQSPISNLQSLSQYEAVQLFLDRAHAAQPHFALTAQNAHAVAQICQRLDGIPLALELAAARVKVLSVEQIVARLDDRFRLLTGGSRTALPRQQTLRALIDWSYDLLPAPERALLRQLSVFAGGWTLEAAEAICADPDNLELLSHLVDKSLVLVEEQGDEARYRLLETIRQYAREKLVEAGEAVTARDRHLDYLLRYAGKADEKIFGPEAIVWLDRLTTESDNMRAALEWALESRPETAMQLIGALGEFWLARHYETEGRAWCESALARVEALPLLPEGNEAARERMTARARVLSVMAFMAIQRGDHRAGRAAAEEGVALARQTGDLRRLVRVLRTLGLATTFSGDPALGLASVQEGEAISRQMGYKVELMGVLWALATITMAVQRDEERVRAYLEEGVALARETGIPWASSMAEFGLVRLAAQRGDMAEARMRAERILSFLRERGDRVTITNIQSELAHGLRKHGELEEAHALYGKTILEWQEFGHRAAVAHELECMAFIAGAQGQTQPAAKLLGAAEALREVCGSPMTPVERIEYDQAVLQLREQVDEVTLKIAWAGGRAMGMEQAVEYALQTGP